ncbi:hypothetical protein FQR65_LT11801 [Abscondita terminalis]|nr:hypothetical protein FQR65_LT11801 [Abscondita terminalis]
MNWRLIYIMQVLLTIANCADVFKDYKKVEEEYIGKKSSSFLQNFHVIKLDQVKDASDESLHHQFKRATELPYYCFIFNSCVQFLCKCEINE